MPCSFTHLTLDEHRRLMRLRDAKLVVPGHVSCENRSGPSPGGVWLLETSFSSDEASASGRTLSSSA